MYIKNSAINSWLKTYTNKNINISYSFISSWKSCQFATFLDYIVRVNFIETNERNFIVGTVFHNLFEQWYRTKEFNTEWLYDNYERYFDIEVKKVKCIKWNGGEKKDREYMLNKLKGFIDNQIEIIKEYDLTNGDYLIEELFEIKEKNFNIKFKGYIDLLFQKNNGELWILDYKTQSNKNIIIEQLLIYYFGYTKYIQKKYKDKFKSKPDKVGIILPNFKEIIFREVSEIMVNKFIKNNVLGVVKEVRNSLKEGQISCNRKSCLSYGEFCKYRQYCPGWDKDIEPLIERCESIGVDEYFK